VSAVFKIDFQEGCNLLREFWLSTIWIQSMLKLLGFDLLSDPHYRRFLGVAKKGSGIGQEVVDEGDEMRHSEARPGDALICLFECNDCCFYRIQHYWPEWKDPQEIVLGAYIHQANLDAFCARYAFCAR
jgi:hypothetical protein